MRDPTARQIIEALTATRVADSRAPDPIGKHDARAVELLAIQLIKVGMT